MQRLREVLLWAGAALGLLAIAAGLAVTFFGFSFLIFRSGSMEPEIQTGAIALSRAVQAEQIRPGDVVSVVAANGDRITHRVVSSTLRGDEAALVLKGDANAVEDSEIYVVTSAERVVASVPFGGYVIAHALTPPGIVAMACLSLMLFISGSVRDVEDEDDHESDDDDLRSDEPRTPGGKHRGPRRFAVAALVAATAIGGSSATLAAFTDPATAGTGGFSSTSIAVPPAPAVAQTSSIDQAAKITWDAVPVGPNGLTATSYDILRYETQAGQPVVLCERTTIRSCTDTASPALTVTWNYAVRARYGSVWMTEGVRQPYQPTVISSTLTISRPTSESRTAEAQRADVNCAASAPACGTASPGSSVTYVFTRTTVKGARQCWNGATWVAAGSCGTTQATGPGLTSSTWIVPGSEDVAYINGENGRGVYTLVVTASNLLSTSSQTVSFTIT